MLFRSEAPTVNGAVKDAGRVDPVRPECGKEGQGPPFTERRLGDELASAWRPASDWGHVRLGPCLVEKDQAAGINPTLILLPLHSPTRDHWSVLFGGEQRFF